MEILDDVDTEDLETVLATTETIQEEIEDMDSLEDVKTWLQMFKGTIESELD